MAGCAGHDGKRRCRRLSFCSQVSAIPDFRPGPAAPLPADKARRRRGRDLRHAIAAASARTPPRPASARPALLEVEASPALQRLVAAAGILYLLSALLILKADRHPLPAMPAIVVVYGTTLILTEGATAVLLFGMVAGTRRWSILLLSAAYLFSAEMAVLHLLTFPGALVPDRPLLGGMASASTVFVIWRTGFPVMSALGLGAEFWRAGSTPLRTPAAAVVLACLAVTALNLAFGAVTISAGEALSQAGDSDTAYSIRNVAVSWAAVCVNLLAAICAMFLARERRALYLWLALAFFGFAIELALGTYGGARYTVGWYAGRVIGILSALPLFAFFLGCFSWQNRMLARAADDAQHRTTVLEAEIERRKTAEARLAQAQKMEAVGRVVGGVAHDFNNILAAVLGVLELLRKQPADARVHRLLDTATSAAERGAAITAQMLAFSRRQEIEIAPLDVNAVILGMRDMLPPAVGPLVRIAYDLSPELWPALANGGQLETAILNLALNARDAMRDGGELLLRTANTVIAAGHTALSAGDIAPGRYVRLSVIDTGEGMSPDVQARAFDPFFTTKDPGAGSGLGLSQVLGFAAQVGGGAHLESSPGQGTRVSLFIPVSE